MKQPLQIGNIDIFWLKGGDFRLDGGTMFGPVPKLLWQKRYEVDENNLIPLCNDPILIKTPENNIVIDSGLGNKLTEKQQAIFHVSPPWDIPAQLEELGLSREDIDFVILTHCDFDHAGGVVMHNDNGDEELTWPNATHIIQKKEWYDVENPCRRAKSTYWPHNFNELKQNGTCDKIILNKRLHINVTRKSFYPFNSITHVQQPLNAVFTLVSHKYTSGRVQYFSKCMI
jgi:hypothetical protein